VIDGLAGEAEIVHCELNLVIIKPLRWSEPETAGPEVDLIVALPRPQTVKKLLVIAGMLRVRRLSFIRANRVEKSFYQSPLLTPDAMAPFLWEGVSQGKHTRLPQVDICDRFRPFVQDTLATRLSSEPNARCFIPTPEAVATLAEATRADNATIFAAIGPEGGWVPFEIEEFVLRGFQPVVLSRSILRVEHAALAFLAQLELPYLRNNRP
jgi:RsmE family RNA methyltransferase